MYLVVSQDACVRTALWSIFLFGFFVQLFRYPVATRYNHGLERLGTQSEQRALDVGKNGPIAKWRRKSKHSCHVENTTGKVGYLHLRTAFEMWEVENTYPSDGKPSIVRA